MLEPTSHYEDDVEDDDDDELVKEDNDDDKLNNIAQLFISTVSSSPESVQHVADTYPNTTALLTTRINADGMFIFICETNLFFLILSSLYNR